MAQGWIKLHRDICDDPMYFSQVFTDNQAYIDLNLIANHKSAVMNVKGIRLTVPRGHVGWLKDSLAQRWQWSRGKVDRFLLYLQKEGYIEHKVTSPVKLIHLLHYESNQDREATDRAKDSQQATHNPGTSQPTNKNGKNGKNDNNHDFLPEKRGAPIKEGAATSEEAIAFLYKPQQEFFQEMYDKYGTTLEVLESTCYSLTNWIETLPQPFNGNIEKTLEDALRKKALPNSKYNQEPKATNPAMQAKLANVKSRHSIGRK